MLYEDLQDNYLQTSFGKVHYKSNEGGKEKIVFLHGLAASTKSWSKLMEQLPSSLGVYLIDLLGHGDSQAPDIAYTVKAQADMVKEFIDQKKLDNCYLFGHSYGGWIAATMAQDNYKGNGIILEDAVGVGEFFSDIEKNEDLQAYREKLIKEALLTNPNERVVKSTIESETPEMFLTKESLSRIATPTLVIWGNSDNTVGIKYGLLLSGYIKGSRLEVIEGAGHVPHYSRPDKVSDLLLRFVGFSA